MDVIGQRFEGGFQILRELGKGALARVYLASDGHVIKAVKLFPSEHAERAQLEFRYGSRLDHPNLNPVERLVEVAGLPGVMMPFAPGQRLGHWLGELPAGPSEQGRFLRSLAGIVDGLGFLHGRRIVHRDVKPENILVDGRAHARLVDFDLAVGLGEPRRLSALAGTVAYLSPEQARGEMACEASDLYALGVILYRALTGEVPFTGAVDEVLEAHRTVTPPPPSRFEPTLAPFDDLLERLLAKEPAARPGAHETLRELARLERG